MKKVSILDLCKGRVDYNDVLQNTPVGSFLHSKKLHGLASVVAMAELALIGVKQDNVDLVCGCKEKQNPIDAIFTTNKPIDWNNEIPF